MTSDEKRASNLAAVKRYQSSDKGRAAAARWQDENRVEQNAKSAARYVEKRESRNATQRAYYAKNREAILRKSSLDRFGVDKEAMIADQGSRCAICSQEFGSSELAPAIDHDHACCDRNGSCGSCVRGILCTACNRGLGAFGDDPERLMAAVAYLLARVDVLGGTP